MIMINQESKSLLRAISLIVFFGAYFAIISIIAGQGYVFLKKANKEAQILIHKIRQYQPAFEIKEVKKGEYQPRFFLKKRKNKKMMKKN